MRAFSIAIPVVGFAVVRVFANEDPKVHGRSPFDVEIALRARGVASSGVEQWGKYIRVYVRDDAGGTSMQFFDPDTLEQVEPFGN